MKTCTKCGSSDRTPDNRCRPCKMEYMREYARKNRARLREQRKAWAKANPERWAESQHRWREANKDKTRARKRRWIENNRERKAEHGRKRRALQVAATIEPVDIAALPTGTCGICLKSLDHGLRHPHPMSPSIDHILPLSKGGSHSQDNLQWAHLVCNDIKGNRGN